MKRNPGWLALLLVACVLMPIGIGAAAEEREQPVIDAVLSMLEAGLSQDVIVAWLDSGEESVPRPSAEQLLALEAAGAEAELLERLLTRSSAGAPPAAQAVAAGPTVDTPDREETAKQPAPSSEPGTAEAVELRTEPGAVAAPTAAAESVQMSFTFSYSPWYLNEDEIELNEESWDFFVYMDGVPVSYVPASVVSGMSSELEFTQMVEPGSHVVRVTLERHTRVRGGAWKHAARVAEEKFPIEVAADGPEASLTVRFKENWGRLGQGPLEFSFSQGNVVRELEGVGGEPEGWPLICEEIEANLDPGEPTPGEVERELESCVRWADLWQGRWAPPRDEVRDALAMFDFRPVPKGS